MSQISADKEPCPISHQHCNDDCDSCLEWLCTCDNCGCAGHVDTDGWIGDFKGHNPPLVYCENCAVKLNI